MLDYTNDPKLLEEAFRLVRLADHIDVALTIGDYRFDPFNDEDPNLFDFLKLLSLSEIGGWMEAVCDMLNRALGEPEETLSDLGEVREAQSVLKKHLMSGLIDNIEWSSTERELYVTHCA